MSRPTTQALDLQAFSRDLDALNGRVSQLRMSSVSAGDSRGDALDAALLELEMAEEELRACRDELEISSQQITRQLGRHERERQLLRQVFRHAPFGLFVLDAHGAIRQANPRAAAMAGTPLEFMAGKPMPVFIDMAARATFRSHLASVLRSGRESMIRTQLAGRAHPVDAWIGLSRLTGPDSSQPLAMAAAWAGKMTVEIGPAPYPKAAQVAAMVDGSLRLEVMGRMTRLLLSESDASRLIPAAAQSLTADFADWAVIDMLRDGRAERRAVAGPRGPLTTADPDCRVVKDVLKSGGPVLLDPIEDEDAFGHTVSGTPILAAARAGSLVSVALPADGQVSGVLTVIRRAGRRGFSMADAGLFAEIGAHIGLTLSNRGLVDDLL
ncbi:MAG TPA: PAS domain-containing protein [Streptosporangiaceae bacterium]|nr:PAS domain-containing protein [Streptosporangiaceae bacterium]